MGTCIFSLAILLLPALANASTWLIDTNNSRVEFKAHPVLVSSMEGVFHKFSGVAVLNDGDITRSRIKVNIDASSVDTGMETLNKKLRSDGFLDVARYPTATFVSGKITRDGPSSLKVTGNLNLHGVTREVVLDVKGPGAATKDRHGKIRRTVSAVGRINRKDFGLTLNPILGAGLDDGIDLAFDVELIRR